MGGKLDQTSGSEMVGKGDKYAIVAATTTTVKNAPGRACRVLVTVGTGAVTVADNATTLWTKATVAVGDIYELDCPCNTSIVVTAAAGTTVTVVYI